MINKIDSVVIILLLLITSIPIIGLYYPLGHDWIFELVRVAEFKAALQDNQCPPYWAPDLYGGMGSPIFLYYAPLYAFISTLLFSITSNIEISSALAVIFISGAGIYFMYLFLKELLRYHNIFEGSAVRIGLYLFSLSPYLIADKFIRNANAEYTALCFAPLVLYGVIRIARQPLYGTLVVAAGVALTVLAHNLTALVVVAIALVSLIALYASKQKNYLFHGIGGLVLGLGLSAFFWIPALVYKSHIRISELTTGKFDYHMQFKGLLDYFSYDHFYSIGVMVPLILLITAFTIVYSIKSSVRRDIVSTLIFIFFITILFISLMTRASMVLWDNVPFLNLFQFPWRMMGPLAIAAATAGTLTAAYVFTNYSTNKHRTIELIVLLACLANAFPNYTQVKTLPYTASAILPEILSPTGVRTLQLPATVADEYLPKTANVDFYTSKVSNGVGIKQFMLEGFLSAHMDGIYATTNSKSVPDGNLSLDTKNYTDSVLQTSTYPKIEAQKVKGTALSFAIEDEEPGVIHFKRWYFPGWSVYINNEKKEAYADNLGLLSVKYPAGKSLVKVDMSAPKFRQVGLNISQLFLMLWVVIFMKYIIERYRRVAGE